ncbi:MAG TPA: holo-ACP synthase [Pelobium sp.]
MESLVNELNPDQEFAVGNDVVFLPNFEQSFNTLFKKKVYTTKEIDYCERFDEAILHYASTWAAKEAVYKAIKQMYPNPLSFKKIEILRSKIGGKPSVCLPVFYRRLQISLSLSHDGQYVWAAAIAKIKL